MTCLANPAAYSVLQQSMSTPILAEEETIRLSVSSAGVEGNDLSQLPMTRQVHLVSRHTSGAQGNDESRRPFITPDGRYVAFVSKADNLVSGDNNFKEDIFLHSRLTLMADSDILPEAGGTVHFTLDAGYESASRSYLLLGSATGTAPGTSLPGGMSTLPLNWDAFTSIVIALANTAVFTDFMGTLDASGQGAAQMNAPALPVGSIGLVMYFAYALIGPCDFSSNPV